MTDDSLELMRTMVVARICPVCLEQVEPDPDGDILCWHYGTSIEPVEVDAYPFLDELRSKRALALFRLQTDIREHELAEAEKRWYEGLSVADRFWEDSRRKRVRREEAEARRAQMPRPFDAPGSMVSFNAAMRDIWTAELVTADPNRQFFTDWIRYPSAAALDDWLARDGEIPEVAAALGL